MDKSQLKMVGLSLSVASMIINIAASLVSEKQLDIKIDERIKEILKNQQ